MYIRVCAKHTCVHRFNVNSAPNEEEEGLSASIVCWTLQPSDPVLCHGLQDLAPRRWLLPSLLLFALSQQQPDPGRLGTGSGSARVEDKEPFADCRIPGRSRSGAWDAGEAAKAPPWLRVCSGLSHIPCACSSVDVPTPSLYREVSVWSVQTFFFFFVLLLFLLLGKSHPRRRPCDAQMFFFTPHSRQLIHRISKDLKGISDFTCINYPCSGSP